MTPSMGITVAIVLVAIVVGAAIVVRAARRAADKAVQAKTRRSLPLARQITVDRSRWIETERALLDLGASPEEMHGIIAAAAIMAEDLAEIRGCSLQDAEHAISLALVRPLAQHHQRPTQTAPSILPVEGGLPPATTEQIADQARRVAAAVAERTVKAITSRATKLGRSPLAPTHDPGRGRASWTVKDVAALTRWPERTVYTWAQAGRIPCERSGRRVRFHAGEVRAWWQQYRRERTSQPPTSPETEGGQVDLPFAKEA